MRWPIHWFFVISLALSIKANTERSKRDLQTLLNIKRSLISSIFGDGYTDSSEKSTSDSVKLFKIPDHDKILVKAIPIEKHPEKVVEVTHGFDTNPTMALLQSYLGTKTYEETLVALERVKTLLASGVISDTVALEKLLIPQPPSIKHGIPTPLDIVSPINPTSFQAPLEFISKPLDVCEKVVTGPGVSYIVPTISGLPCDLHGVPLPGSVVFSDERPFWFSEPHSLTQPILPPRILVPEVIAPEPPITFELPQLLIPEFKPLNVRKIIQTPVFPSSYSYHQIHNDGSITTTLTKDVERPIPDLVKPIVERINQNSEKISDLSKPVKNLPGVFLPDILGPVKIKEISKEASPGGFSYHQVQDDDSVTTFTNSGIQNPVPLSFVGKEEPVVKAIFDDSSKPVVIPVSPKLSRLIKRPDGKGGFVYVRINDDESITNFFEHDGSKLLSLNDSGNIKPVPITHNIFLNRIGQIAEAIAIPNAEKDQVINNSRSSIGNFPDGFSYHLVQDDDSVTTFTNGGIQNSVPLSSVGEEEPVVQPILGPVKIQEISNEERPGGYSYHQVQDDDSVTTFTNGGIQNPVLLSSVGKEEPVVQPTIFDDLPTPVVIPVPPKLSRLIKRPDGKGGFVYVHINDDESITTLSENDGRKLLSLNGSGNIKPVPITHNILLNRIGQIAETMAIPKAEKDQVINKSPSTSRYSYKQIKSDGSVITYTGSGKPYITQVSDSSITTAEPFSITLPAPLPPVVGTPGLKPYPVFLEGEDWYTPLIGPAPVLPLTEVQKVWLPKNRPVDVHKISTTSNNRFSYQQITSDGSAITKNPGNKHFISVSSPVSFVPGSPTTTYGVPFSGPAFGTETKAFVSELPKVSLPVFRPVQVLPTAPNGYIFKQILKDGSTATYIGDGKIERPNKLTVSSISPRPSFSTPPGSPDSPPTTISFATPVVTSYLYKQTVPNNQNFTVVNVDHGFSHPKDFTFHTTDRTQLAEEQTYSIDRRLNTATRVGKSKPHGADHDDLSVVVQKTSTNIHTASGSFNDVQHSDISSDNSDNESNTLESTFKNNPIVVAPEDNSSFYEVNEASKDVHRGDIP